MLRSQTDERSRPRSHGGTRQMLHYPALILSPDLATPATPGSVFLLFLSKPGTPTESTDTSNCLRLACTKPAHLRMSHPVWSYLVQAARYASKLTDLLAFTTCQKHRKTASGKNAAPKRTSCVFGRLQKVSRYVVCLCQVLP